MTRIAVARVWHEANSFSPVPTRLADFERREWVAGDAAVAFYSGTRTELGAAVDFARAHGDWQVEFLHCCAAPPGGIVVANAAHEIRARILEGLRARRWDGVYLSLHGAMIDGENPSFELDLLRAVRRIAGATRIAATFDLHANLAPEIARLVDVLCGYRTYPHVDMYETGERALALLARTLRGEISPVIEIAKVGAILASHNMRTAAGPMREIEDEASRLEAEPGVFDVTPFGGFVYGDSPWAGASVAVTAATGTQASRVGAQLADFVRERRHLFDVALPSATEGIERALAEPPIDGRPVAVLEPSDNPLSGGAGDTTGLFRALVERVGDVPAVFAFFWDPALVARAHAAGAGATLDCTLGGRLAPQFGAPVPVSARVTRLTDGRFVNTGPMETGLRVDLGRTAVLGVGPLQVIVTETCQSPNDRAYFALHGIDLAAVRLLAAKAKNHFRAAFADASATIVDVDTPGPAAAAWRELPFRQVPAGLLR
jgi:microcystin degradation protein MlrC